MVVRNQSLERQSNELTLDGLAARVGDAAVATESTSPRDCLEAWTTEDGGWESASPRDDEIASVRSCLHDHD